MGIFDFLKTKPEIGQHGISDVIENEDTTGLFMWKSPIVDFNNNSTLIVKDGETALFVKNGTIVGEYSQSNSTPTEGKGYEHIKLRTENFPFLRNVAEKFTGGRTAYTCSVYFVRTDVYSTEIKWGMAPLRMHDKITKLEQMMSAYGAYNYKVVDPKAFYKSAKGAVAVSDQDVLKSLGSKAQQKIIGILMKFIDEAGYTFNTISQNIMKMDVDGSNFEIDFLNALNRTPIFKEFGIEVNTFSLCGLKFSDDGLTESDIQKNRALANRVDIGILGKNWDSVRNKDILMAAATNSGPAGTMAGMGVGGLMMGSMQDMISGNIQAPIMDPNEPGGVAASPVVTTGSTPYIADIPDATGGKAVEDEMNRIRKKIMDLKNDLRDGIISEDMYEGMLKSLQNRLRTLYDN